MQRERADGHVLSWRLLFPSGQRWRDIAPFVIEWVTSDADRIAWDAPVAHPNGVTGVSGLAVAVPDLARARMLYAGALGLATAPSGPGRARAALGDVSVDLVTGGEGVHELTLGVRDMAQAARAIPGLSRGADGEQCVIPLEPAVGARLVLAEVSGPGS